MGLLDSIISMGAGLIGSMFNTDYNTHSQKKLMDYAYDMNSPANQMQRMLDAGITPGAAAQGISGAPAAGAMATNSAQTSESKMGDYLYNQRLMDEQVKEANAEAKKIATDAHLNSQQARLFEATYVAAVDIKDAEAAKLWKEIDQIDSMTDGIEKDNRQKEWLYRFCIQHGIDPSNYDYKNKLSMMGEDVLHFIYEETKKALPENKEYESTKESRRNLDSYRATNIHFNPRQKQVNDLYDESFYDKLYNYK